MARTPGSRRRTGGTSRARTSGPGLKVARSRGAFSGLLLVLLGIWGGLVPMVGPYLHYAYTPDKAWTFTSGRAWLEFAPAAAAILGGIVLLASKLRPMALFGAALAVAGGAWFTIGSVVVKFWMRTPPAQGVPVGGAIARAAEQIGFFTGLGAAIICVAAIAIGRLAVISTRDAKMAERAAEGPEAILSDPRPTEATTPISAGGTSEATTASTSTGRKTPMAALTRIASKNKSAGQTGDAADSKAPEADQLSSSSGRR